MSAPDPIPSEDTLVLGQRLLQAGRHDEAAAVFERALAEDARRFGALIGLGLAESAGRRPDAAIAAYRRGTFACAT